MHCIKYTRDHLKCIVECVSYSILYKGPEHKQILVSAEGSRTNSLWTPRADWYLKSKNNASGRFYFPCFTKEKMEFRVLNDLPEATSLVSAGAGTRIPDPLAPESEILMLCPPVSIVCSSLCDS